MDFAAKAAVARVVGITTRLRIEAAKVDQREECCCRPDTLVDRRPRFLERELSEAAND